MSTIMPKAIWDAYGGPVNCFDESGNPVDGVRWIDPEAGTFATMIKDETTGDWAIDWEKDEPIEIVRHGRLRLEPKCPSP